MPFTPCKTNKMNGIRRRKKVIGIKWCHGISPRILLKYSTKKKNTHGFSRCYFKSSYSVFFKSLTSYLSGNFQRTVFIIFKCFASESQNVCWNFSRDLFRHFSRDFLEQVVQGFCRNFSRDSLHIFEISFFSQTSKYPISRDSNNYFKHHPWDFQIKVYSSEKSQNSLRDYSKEIFKFSFRIYVFLPVVIVLTRFTK